MKINTNKKFIEYIKNNKLSEKNESIARLQFLSGELDDHHFNIHVGKWCNR